MKKDIPEIDMKGQYALLVDPHSGQIFNLCRFATAIGRSVACDVILTDKSVSRQHALIYCIRGKFYIEDVGSTNGTMLNGKVITGRSTISSGDEVRLGITRLVFLLVPDHLGFKNSLIDQHPTMLIPSN